MKLWKKLVAICLDFCFCLGVFTLSVKAAGSTFTVIPQASPEQMGSINQGWYLKVQPDHDYQITFQIANFLSSTNVIEVIPVIVQTNSQLQLSLDEPNAQPGPHAQYDFRKLTTGKTLTLQPQQRVTETINLHVPAAGIRGILMGGLLFRSQTDLQKQKDSLQNQGKNQSAFLSTAAISYGLYLQQAMTKLKVHLNVGAPRLRLQNQQPLLITPVKNLTAYPFSKGRLKLQVTNPKNHALNFTKTMNNIDLAANSQVDWLFPWQKGPLLAGKYYLKYTFTNPRMHYEFKRTLILSDKQVQELNRYLPEKPRDYQVIFIVIAIITVCLLILLTFLVYHYGLWQKRKD